jgi:hypothetical protein
MQNLMIDGKTNFMGINIPNISGGFGKGQRSILAREVALIHGRGINHINELINNNRKRFIDGVDIIDLKQIGENDVFLQLGLKKAQVGNANNIYLLSERGYAKLIKIMDDDLAWKIHDKLIDEYFTMREEKQKYNQNDFSPELQLLIKLELEQKKHAVDIADNKSEIKSIRDAIQINPKNWRVATNQIINQIAEKSGKYTVKQKKDLYNELYTAINNRMNVKLSIRLKHKKERMEEQGVNKSKIEVTNCLDVIEDDKKLIFACISILKEMCIKYNVGVK